MTAAVPAEPADVAAQAEPVPVEPATARAGVLRGVLFDMDGLLVDSEPVWSVAEAEIMAWLGGPWNLDIKARLIGRRVDEACRLFVELAGSAESPEEVERRLVARMCELFRADLPVLPGALELIDAVRAAGLATALVSSSYRALIDAALESIGAHRFDVTIGGDEVTYAKPHPEPYATAAARLGLHPADCVVLEDSLTGAEAGVAAGCPVVVIPNVVGVTPAPGRAVVASLTDVTVERLAELVAARG